MNPHLFSLQPYPFQRLTKLKAQSQLLSSAPAIDLSIGEPQQPTPAFIQDALIAALPQSLRKYSSTQGSETLRVSIGRWLAQRFQLPTNVLDPNSQVLPVNGTREALFAFAQCVVHAKATEPLVLMPNPFYQIYEGAAFLAGAQPWFINCSEADGFQPDFASVPAHVWRHCHLLYLCSPGNPSGSVLDIAILQKLIAYADEYDFIIAADECYSELYAQEPPVGLLQAAYQLGRTDFKRCIVFHSLSKRSSAPGLRSGFVAGDAEIIQQFLLYRTYHGCAMPLATQAASTVAWQDERHVVANREGYRQKYAAVLDILAPVLPVTMPPASFYLWPRVPIADEVFAQGLFARHNVTVLPGSYLARDAQGVNPGLNRVRIALVPSLEECVEAAYRIRTFVETL